MKDRIQLVSQVFAALEHPHRIRIVEMQRGGERFQCHLPEDLGIEHSNLSPDIKVLISTSRLEGNT